jgi:hypothetical protein
MVAVEKTFGHFWGIPHSKTIVSLENADILAAVGAAAGMGRALALAGGGLALGVAAVATFANLARGREKYSWHQLVEAGTFNRKFTGVCLNREFVVLADDQRLTIPVDLIAKYKTKDVVVGQTKFWGNPILERGIDITLFDGSRYVGQLIGTDTLNFVTPVGIQDIAFKNYHNVAGTSVREALSLRTNLKSFLDRSALEAEKIIGEQAFNKFFTRGPS